MISQPYQHPKSIYWVSKLLLLIFFVTELVGCASYSKTPYDFSIESEAKIPRIRKVALVTDLTPPEIDSVDLGFTKGQGVVGGAAAGALGGAAGAGALSGFAMDPYSGAVVLLLLLPVFTVGGAIVGAVSGGVSGNSADMLEEAEANAQRMLNEAYLQKIILERVLDYGLEKVDFEFVRIPNADPEGLENKPDYNALLDESVDVVLEVELLRLTLKDSLEMDARARLVLPETGAVLSDNYYKFLVSLTGLRTG